MKKLLLNLCICFALFIIISANIRVAAMQDNFAAPAQITVIVNGNPVSFEAYEIDGYNYFKLRDLAAALNRTSKQFDVSWNNNNCKIDIISGQSYTFTGDELIITESTNCVSTTVKTSEIYLDNYKTSVDSCNINGYNYFKLRDIAKALGFSINWDSSNNKILIDTTNKYLADSSLINTFFLSNADNQLFSIFNLADAALLSDSNSEFSDAGELTSDGLLNFFLFESGIDSECWYNKEDKKYYIPANDVSEILDKYFVEYNFNPNDVTLAKYDKISNNFVTTATCGLTHPTFIEIKEKKSISDDMVSITANYYDRYQDPKSDKILFSKELILKVTAEGYKIISDELIQ